MTKDDSYINDHTQMLIEKLNPYESDGQNDNEQIGAISLEPIFKQIEHLDSAKDCGKLYVCELAATTDDDLETLAGDERVLLSLLTDKNGISVASSKGPFDMAARLGKVAKNKDMCRTRYSRCDITSKEYESHPFVLR